MQPDLLQWRPPAAPTVEPTPEKFRRAPGDPRDYRAEWEAFVGKLERGADWTTLEVPVALPEALRVAAQQADVVVIDCLTLWLSNLLFASTSEFPDVGPINLPALLHEQRAGLLAEDVCAEEPATAEPAAAGPTWRQASAARPMASAASLRAPAWPLVPFGSRIIAS